MQTQITSNTLTLLRHKCRFLAFPLDKTSFCFHIHRLNANTIHASRARALSMQTQITSNTLTFIRHKCRVLAFPLDKTSFCIHVPVWMQTQLTHLALVPCQCRHKSHQTLLHSYAINALFLPSLLDKTSFCIHVPRLNAPTQPTHLTLVPCKCRHKSHHTFFCINAVFLPSL